MTLYTVIIHVGKETISIETDAPERTARKFYPRRKFEVVQDKPVLPKPKVRRVRRK